ncbi:hypothetical protein PC110_g2375 [Phytophthora cactorum]|uniref:Uncharacterized protein n=1 Tax=Phytophthora cactorum TaxID=29920 RepID=A0A329SZU1_9STRA|nr:hypothetical protein PC110_g2375 [Phytophthora cactorum]
MQPHVFLRPITDEMDRQEGEVEEVGGKQDGGKSRSDSSQSGEAKNNADTGEDENSEHEDVTPEDGRFSSEPATDGESESRDDSGGSSSDEHEAEDEELHDYDDVVADGDLPGVAQECNDSHANLHNLEQGAHDSHDMDIETYELDDVDEMMNQKRILVDRIRSFSERSVKRSSVAETRLWVAGRTSDTSMSLASDKKRKYLEYYIVNSILHPEPIRQKR